MRSRNRSNYSRQESQSTPPRYEVVLSRAAAKDLDQLPLRLLDQLKSKHFLALAIDPRGAGRPKKGQLAGLYGYEFGPRGGYRLLYEVLDQKRLVLIIAIGPHDQAYRRATRRR